MTKVYGYANVTVQTADGPKTNGFFPLKVLPAGGNHEKILLSIFSTLKLKHEDPSHYQIIRCVKQQGPLMNARPIFDISIRAAHSMHQGAASSLAFRVTSYTTKK